MKNLKRLALSVFAASLGIGFANAQSWNPSAVVGVYTVAPGLANTLITQVNAGINRSLYGQVFVSASAPDGISVTPYIEANANDLIGVAITVPDNTPLGQYPVTLTVQDPQTGAVHTVEMLVDVQYPAYQYPAYQYPAYQYPTYQYPAPMTPIPRVHPAQRPRR